LNCPSTHVLAEVYPGVDWVLVEGYRDCNLPKLEIWRAGNGKPVLYANDPFVAAVATDEARQPAHSPTGLPVLNVDDGPAIAQWLMDQGDRFDYDAGRFA
jgi:molybdopterin-guanine dinucleotide biosynthesis protein B